MNEKLSKEKIELFDAVIRILSIAIKNSTLYPLGHPSLDASIKDFKACLDNWLINEGKMDLGISPENILLNGNYVRESNLPYGALAGYLHQRGIISISIARGISLGELIDFFKAIKDGETVPSTPHLKIKEINYIPLLASAKEEVTTEEKDVWESLLQIQDGLIGGQLPETKVEFLVDFLNNPKKSGSVLNKMYKKALMMLDEKSSVENIQKALVRINTYFQEHPVDAVKNVKKNLAEIIMNLDPRLIASLFERSTGESGIFDLAEKISKGFSDDMIVDFIVSFISGEGVINENLLKLFDKLVPDKKKSENIALMVTDKLFEKNMLDKNISTKPQLSINEMFKNHPNNEFMSQMYKMAVETFIDKEARPGAILGKCSVLVTQYLDLLKEENLKKEKIGLLLNILWFENDPAQFKNFSGTVINALKEILNPRYTKSLREAFEFFAEKLRPEQKDNNQITAIAKEALEKLRAIETVSAVASFIPGASREDLDDIAYVLVNAKRHSCRLLLDLFVSEEDSAKRGKFGYVLSMMGKSVSGDISTRLEGMADSNFGVTKDLFKILKAVDIEKARPIAKKMIRHKNTQLRMEALEGLTFETEEEMDSLFEVFKEEKDRDLKKKMLIVLLKTRNSGIINRLFNTFANFLNRGQPLDLVKLCGDFRIKESLPHLERILAKRPLFNTKTRDALRIASVVSLAQIGLPEGIEVIKASLNDRSKPVSKMCRFVLEHDKR